MSAGIVAACDFLLPFAGEGPDSIAHAHSQACAQATTVRLSKAITVDHSTEFTSKSLDKWAWNHDVQLDFIRPGKPVENAYIESFNGWLLDKCLNVQEFVTIDNTRGRIEA